MPRDPSRLTRFALAVTRTDAEIPLDEAALLIGSWAAPALSVEAGVVALDALAARALVGLPADAAPTARLDAMVTSIFRDAGFAGNADDYYDPRNSFLGDVLDRRLGIPITLSVLVLEVAKRVGIEAWGINFPGHFLVGVRTQDGPLVLDPFAGGAAVDNYDLGVMLRRNVGPTAEVDDELLAATSKARILQRILTNLAGIYGQRGDLFGSVEVLEHLQVLDPDNRRIVEDLDKLRGALEPLN